MFYSCLPTLYNERFATSCVNEWDNIIETKTIIQSIYYVTTHYSTFAKLMVVTHMHTIGTACLWLHVFTDNSDISARTDTKLSDTKLYALKDIFIIH